MPKVSAVFQEIDHPSWDATQLSPLATLIRGAGSMFASIMNQSSESRPTLLLDEPLLGLDVFLRDLGWKTVKVEQGMSDDGVLSLAKKTGYVVVTPDRQLVSRCRLLGVRVVDVGLEELAGRVHQILQRDFEITT